MKQEKTSENVQGPGTWIVDRDVLLAVHLVGRRQSIPAGPAVLQHETCSTYDIYTEAVDRCVWRAIKGAGGARASSTRVRDAAWAVPGEKMIESRDHGKGEIYAGNTNFMFISKRAIT
jgi:hypothetical protein